MVARGVGAAGKNTARRIMTRRRARNSGALKIVIRRRVAWPSRGSSSRNTVGAAARRTVEPGGETPLLST